MKKTIMLLLCGMMYFLISVTDGVAYASNYKYAYDSSGRIVEIVSDKGLATHHYYDHNGNLIKQKLDKNLLVNASFTRHNGVTASDWTMIPSSNSQFEMVKEEGHGEWSQKISASGMQKSLYAGVSQDIRVIGNRSFTAKAQVRATILSGVKVQLWVDYLNAKNEYVGAYVEEIETAGGDYRTISLRGTIPETAAFARYYVFIRSTTEAGSGTFFITDASYSYGFDTNLLAHGDFENEADWSCDSSNGWKKIFTNDSDFEIVREEGNGEMAQKVSTSGMHQPLYVGVSQDIKVIGGRTYTAKAQVRTTALNGAKVQLWIDYLNEKNEYVGTNIEEMETVGGDYRTLSITNLIPPTAVYAKYYIFIRSTTETGSGTFYITDASYSYGADDNLLAHSDFENDADWTSGSSNGWKKIDSDHSKFTIIPEATSEKGAQQISVFDLKEQYYVGLSQDIKVIGGKKFKAQSIVRATALSGAKVQLWVDYLNAKNEYVGTNIDEIESAGEKEVTLQVANTIPLTAVYAKFYVFIRSNTEAGSGSFIVTDARYSYDL